MSNKLSKFAAVALVVSLAGAAPFLMGAQSQFPAQFAGGYGMGPGMMGGYGYGMGPWAMGAWSDDLNLSADQQAQIDRIRDETRQSQWALMNQMMDQQFKLRDLYGAPKQDAAAIEQAYKAFSGLRQAMFDNARNAQKRIEAVLTPKQREQLGRYWRNGPVGRP